MWVYLDKEGGGKAPSESQCKGCGADVTWVVNLATGRPSIIDGHELVFAKTDNIADRNGDIVAAGEIELSIPKGRRDRGEEPMHTSHFSTCPQADQFKRR